MDIPKLRQEKESLKMQLELVRNQQSLVFEEIKLRKELLSKLTDENKIIQDKIQELAEIIDYSFLENEKVKCSCNDIEKHNCNTNCDFAGYCPHCKCQLLFQVNSEIKQCVNCGYDSKEH